MGEETEFMKFLDSHKNYLACNAMIDYHDMKNLPGFARNFIIEYIKIPMYKRMIRKRAEEANKYVHINQKI